MRKKPVNTVCAVPGKQCTSFGTWLGTGRYTGRYTCRYTSRYTSRYNTATLTSLIVGYKNSTDHNTRTGNDYESHAMRLQICAICDVNNSMVY